MLNINPTISAKTSKILELLPKTVDWYSSSIKLKNIPAVKPAAIGYFEKSENRQIRSIPSRKYSTKWISLSKMKIYDFGILVPSIEDATIIKQRKKTVKILIFLKFIKILKPLFKLKDLISFFQL